MWGHKPIILDTFCQKLYEIEENLIERGRASLSPLRSATDNNSQSTMTRIMITFTYFQRSEFTGFSLSDTKLTQFHNRPNCPLNQFVCNYLLTITQILAFISQKEECNKAFLVTVL